jgi:2TM domain
MQVLPDKDEKLWRIAKKRASFKRNAFNFVVIIAFLWFLWAIGDRQVGSGIPWPIWPTVGWAVGLTFQFFDAYIGFGLPFSQKENENIKKPQN